MTDVINKSPVLKPSTNESFILSFKRYEAKYLVTRTQYEAFREALSNIIAVDQYGLTRICNLYYDTPNFDLVRISIDKPIYKEKLRLRTYGVPQKANATSFCEIKKKYEGIVYKRREAMPLDIATEYLLKKCQAPNETQITKEIDWFLRFYKDLSPKMFLSYNRIAAYCIHNPELRMTFDTDIMWRTDDLDLLKGNYGNLFMGENYYLIEIKIPDAMPIWLCRILEDIGIVQTSLSKYGECYKISQNLAKPLL